MIEFIDPRAVALVVPFVAVIKETVDELIETGHEVSALPGQVVIGICLILAITYIVWTTKRQIHDQEQREENAKARESQILQQIGLVTQHHEDYVRKGDEERRRHHDREIVLTEQLISLSERSIKAMENMSAATRSLETLIRDRR